MDIDIIIMAICAVVVVAGIRLIYVIRKNNREREERHRLAMKRLEEMRDELERKRRENHRAAMSAPVTKSAPVSNTRTTQRYTPSNGYARTQAVDSDDDSLATMILMNQIVQNNQPVYVDTTPSYSYSSSSSDDSCSRSSYSSSDSYSSSSYDSGSSDSGSSSSCD